MRAGKVFQTGEPIIIDDVSQVPFYLEGDALVQSELAVPVKIGDRIIGILNVESRTKNAFDKDDLALYSTIASQLGVALRNAQIYEEASRRAAHLDSLNAIIGAAASSTDSSSMPPMANRSPVRRCEHGSVPIRTACYRYVQPKRTRTACSRSKPPTDATF